MGDFSADWLALREPADRRARSVRLVRDLVARLAQQRQGMDLGPLRIIDLGCGTGANLRYLAPWLDAGSGLRPREGQDWICVDRDAALLAELMRRARDGSSGLGGLGGMDGLGGLDGLGKLTGLAGQSGNPAVRIRTLELGLAQGLDSLPLAAGTLVVASALLDLVSGQWLEKLLRSCAGSGAVLYLALTYDGRAALSPPHPDDRLVIDLVNAHQRRDKGLGPALGPGAPACLAHLAAGLGLVLASDPSDWDLGGDQGALQGQLIAGWLAAAREQAVIMPDGPRLEEQLSAWHRFRLGQVAEGRLHLRLGHQDCLLFPPFTP